jgi:FkbM family methyltransferase
MNTFNPKTIAKRTIISFLAHYGYEFVRIKDRAETRAIDVLPLIVQDYIQHKTSPGFFFVQIGANDGKRCDPVVPLVEKFGNWKGVLVEPNPREFAALKRNYAARAGLEFECAAIMDFDGRATLYSSNAGGEETILASTDKNVASIGLSKSANTLGQFEVDAVRLETLFAKHHIENIDLFVTDTEGNDYGVMRQLLNGTKIRPGIIFFEHIIMDKLQYAECLRMLGQNGYETLLANNDTIATKPRVS